MFAICNILFVVHYYLFFILTFLFVKNNYLFMLLNYLFPVAEVNYRDFFKKIFFLKYHANIGKCGIRSSHKKDNGTIQI